MPPPFFRHVHDAGANIGIPVLPAYELLRIPQDDRAEGCGGIGPPHDIRMTPDYRIADVLHGFLPEHMLALAHFW
jgi:hypothetical protein